MSERVAPFTGAWIEIIIYVTVCVEQHMSLPSRERGLKFYWPINLNPYRTSLPSRERGLKYQAYPLVLYQLWSLPSRERGLKFSLPSLLVRSENVAPFTGAWIEIKKTTTKRLSRKGRSLHGSVD